MSAKKITIENLSILKSPYVHIKNESAVFEKINAIVCQGVDKLQFVTDFDDTITKQHEDGKLTRSSIDILFEWGQFPESTARAFNAALLRFQVITSDPTKPPEQRTHAVDQLYETVHKEVQGHELGRAEIEKLVREYGPSFRDGTKELFSALRDLSIPAVVFSAGFADVIEQQLIQNDIPHDSITLMGNRLKFNGTTLGGLQNYGNLINSFNKHQHLYGYLNTDNSKSRRNFILMGDHTGDATMVRDCENEGTVLKIGFFYRQTNDSLEIFKETFDIVLEDDQTMNVVLDIIKLLE